MSYQAIIRNSSSELVVNHAVGMQISILQGTPTGSVVYTETQIPTTNANGLVSIEFGGGEGFDVINWANGPYFLKTEVDPGGGSVYSITGTSQLLSVPYALHAKTAANFTETDPEVGANTTNYLSKWNGTALVSSTIFDNGKIGIGINNPSSLLDLHIPDNFSASGLNISMPDVSNQTINHQALTISSAWEDEGIARTSIFSLEDEESSPIMTLRRLGYSHQTILTPGSISVIGETGNNISMNWEEGFSYGSPASGYNIQINTETPFNYRTYAGTWIDRAKIDNQGNVYFAGNLQLGGNFIGEIEIDSIHVSKITGLLGQNFTLIFPDILNNLVSMDIDGITLTNKVVMISGPGIETERIIGYHDPDHHNDQPGLSMEFPVIFETSGTDAQTLKTWFDTPDPPIHVCSIIIRNLAGDEISRWNLFEFKPDGYVPGNDGRTRFTMVHRLLPDNVMNCQYEGDFGTDYAINPETDKQVQIDGVETGIWFFPKVEVDYANRTITLTMDYNEGGTIDNWVRQIVNGTGSKRDVVIIETNLDIPPVETSRRNYYECFPIKYEHIYGFGLNTKLKARIVISFNWWEQ